MLVVRKYVQQFRMTHYRVTTKYLPDFKIFFSYLKYKQNDGIIFFVKQYLNADLYYYNHIE